MKQKLIGYVRSFMSSPRYPFLVALVGFLDMFLLIVPNDLLLVSGVLANPKRWRSSAFIVTLGSTFGVWALALFLLAGYSTFLGTPLQEHSPIWIETQRNFRIYGDWAILLGAAAPVPVQIFVIAAVWAKIPVGKIVLLVFAGRLIKYFTLAFMASRFPHLLNRIFARLRIGLGTD
ncbi:MAG: YqaA family protein [Bdellovibrionota bacterium]